MQHSAIRIQSTGLPNRSPLTLLSNYQENEREECEAMTLVRCGIINVLTSSALHELGRNVTNRKASGRKIQFQKK
jgi:hypothetical protein